eukprot:gene7076-10904_t
MRRLPKNLAVERTRRPEPPIASRDWFVVDAAGQTLGRLATEVASRLRGKHKPEYTPHVDTGDYIVIINAEQVRVTGNKAQDKMYYRHSGFPGGIKSSNFEGLISKKPEAPIEIAVKGRRRFLVAATSVVGAAGAVGAAVPFVGSWFPSAKAKAAGAPVKVNVSKIDPGQQMIAEWRGQPVFIVRRTEEILGNLKKIEGQLSDPDSKNSDQPAYVDKEIRSIKPEILLLIGICTHLGCSPTFRPEVAPADLGKDWVGGYFCPCHGSHYDLAGRVYNSATSLRD